MAAAKSALFAFFLPAVVCSSEAGDATDVGALADTGASSAETDTPTEAGADVGTQSSTPARVDLAVPVPIYNGWTFEAEIRGALPGEIVRLYASDAAPAGGEACPPDGGGSCLDLPSPIALGDGIADEFGTARILVYTEYVLPRPRWYQAAVVSGQPGISDVVRTDPLAMDTDSDRDGAYDPVEYWLRTNPDDPDSDDDGIKDGQDPAPLVPGPFDDFVADDRLASSPDRNVVDPEFEVGTGRFVWQTANGGELWAGRLDLHTGDLVPPDGRGVLVATGVAPMEPSENGPEWVHSSRGGRVVFTVENPNVPGDYRLAHGWENTDGTWSVALQPGAPRGLAPLGQQDPRSPVDRLVYFRRSPLGVSQAFVRVVDRRRSDDKIPPELVNFDLRYTTGVGNWVMGTAPHGDLTSPYGDVYEQIFVHHPVSNRTVWLTNDPLHKFEGYVWTDPRTGRFVALAARGEQFLGRTDIGVWSQQEDGNFVLTKVITPPAGFPYVLQPRPFVWGDRSYVAFGVSKRRRARDGGGVGQIWLASTDADSDLVRRLDTRGRLGKFDPEVVTYGARPWVYYMESGRDPVTGGTYRHIRRCELGLDP